MLFNAKSHFYIYIKYIQFGLVVFYGILTLVGYLMPNPDNIYIYIYIYIYTCIYISSCHTTNMDFTASLLLFFTIFHHFQQVSKTTSCVCAEALLVSSCWSTNTCMSV